MIRADVNRALARAVSWETFVAGLRKMGYSVRYGPNIKYATLRHKTGSRNIRLKSLGEGYDEASIRNLLERRARGEEVKLPRAAEDAARTRSIRDKPIPEVPARRVRRVRLRGALPVVPRRKYTGFMALYYRYVYLLGKHGSGAPRAAATFCCARIFKSLTGMLPNSNLCGKTASNHRRNWTR